MNHYSLKRIIEISPAFTCVDVVTLKNRLCRFENVARARAIVEGVALDLTDASATEIAAELRCDQTSLKRRVEKYWLKGMTECERGELLDRFRDAMDAARLREERAA